MSNSSIPVIDMSPLMTRCVEGQGEAASEIQELVSVLSSAVASHGIFAIVGHGIPQDLMTTALEATKFALEKGGPAETECWAEHEAKARIVGSDGGVPSFSAAGAENVGCFYGNANAPKELVAKFTVFPPHWDSNPTLLKANVWPITSAGQTLRRPLEQYFAKVQCASDALHRGLSECLGRPRTFIEESLTPHTDGALRAMRYQHKEEGSEEMAPAMAAHKDLNTTTLLCSDAPGLQFQPRGSEDWVDVIVPAGALIVNLGQFFEIWTGGAWRATPHRVIKAGQHGRTSLAFFSNTGIARSSDGSTPKDRRIEPIGGLSSDSDADGETSAWSGIQTAVVGEARKSIAWPAFYFERVADLASRQQANIEGVQAGRGGA
eukprot:CAMPEP_0115071534 /NCGR_PEP_ID=MMETSP0227-20121206/13724_1 /TAXON_ID=89957 /ORGANISM="Polarella glacialis, Strain CCMP 1383" /LENGTH=376 /DNA_ID=CAMNT_0002458173 /DNA_START=66 /DNA_END=1196 /DNA_ORIENTATION=+